MSEDTKYNGWTNYETWRVNLEYFDGGDWNERAEELAQELIDADDDISDLASNLADEMRESLESYIDETSTQGLVQDYANAFVSHVNYDDIARHYAEEVDIWAAGWNMPGYMPDNAPALFVGWDAARDYLAEEMGRARDEMEDGKEDPGYMAAIDHLVGELPGNSEYGQTVGAYHWFLTKGGIKWN